MISRIFPQSHYRKIFNEKNISGPMPWVIAIMMVITMLAAFFALTIWNSLDNINADLAGKASVQILEANAEKKNTAIIAANDLLKAHPAVKQTNTLPESQIEDLLSPWLGGEQLDEDIPLPAIIDVTFSQTLTPAIMDELRSQLTAKIDNVRMDSHGDWLKPVFNFMTTLQWLAITIVIALILATMFVVILAARGALKNHSQTIEVVHILGATDRQIARLFQRRITLDTAWSALGGALAAVILIMLISWQSARLDNIFLTTDGLPLAQWLILLFLPVLVIMLAFWTARQTIFRALRVMI